MDINNVSGVSAYNYQNTYAKTKEETQTAEETAKKESASAVVYEKSSTDRSAIIAQLKADQESQTNKLMSYVYEMMGQQGQQFGFAQDEDSVWKFLASGNYTVSEAAKAQAQEAISEGGFWSVEETSKRIVDFAKALTGGDSSKVDSMREAFEKGYKQATKSWGQELPSISKETYDVVMGLFDDWANGGAAAESTAASANSPSA